MDFERKRPPDRIGKYIFVSLMIHVLTAVVFTVKAIFFAEEAILFEPAIKVDLVALPDKMMEEPTAAPAAAEPAAAEPTPPPVAEEKKPEPPPPAPTPPPKPASEPVVKIEPKKEEKKKPDLAEQQRKQKEALAKLKQQSALEEIENEIKESEKKKAAAAATKKEFKGNVISPGTSLTGVSKLQAESYISDVYRHMKDNWALPDYLRQRSLITEVLVKFDQQGNIVSKTMIKSSGNSAFDDLVLTAVQKSSPVPPPPEKFVRISEYQGFLFRFSE